MVSGLATATAQDNMAVAIAFGANDHTLPIVVNPEEVVWSAYGKHGIDRRQIPSVLFLNPTGAERPLAISRCVWDSVVRAPMAYQETRSKCTAD